MARASRLLLAAAVYFCAAVAAGPSRAVVLDMEDFAPANGHVAANTNTVMNGFNLQAFGGSLSRWIDSGWANTQPLLPNNGTDWLYHGDAGLLTITRVGGGAFSITRFDATFNQSDYLNSQFTNNDIVVVGTLAGGGSISQTFTVDEVHAFETFNFGAGWANLLAVTFQNPNGIGGVFGGLMAYDNIVVDASAVPVPAALPLFATILAGGGLIAWRRKRKTTVVAARCNSTATDAAV